MMDLRKWIINKLGGITKEQKEETRITYEKWAVKHLTGKNKEVTPDCLLYLPFDGDDIVIISSRTTITGGRVKGIKIAPWCKDVICESPIIL